MLLLHSVWKHSAAFFFFFNFIGFCEFGWTDRSQLCDWCEEKYIYFIQLKPREISRASTTINLGPSFMRRREFLDKTWNKNQNRAEAISLFRQAGIYALIHCMKQSSNNAAIRFLHDVTVFCQSVNTQFQTVVLCLLLSSIRFDGCESLNVSWFDSDSWGHDSVQTILTLSLTLDLRIDTLHSVSITLIALG